LNENIDLEHLLSSTKLTGNELTDYQDEIVNLYENQFYINFKNYKYNTEKGYCKIDYTNKITWIFTNLHDLQKCFNNLKDIDKIYENIDLIKTNENSNQEYLNIKNKIRFDEECIKYFYEKEKKILNFYNLDS
jgi:hypothetical protein